MSNKKFYLTTPIYYTNSIPHIGHANSSLLADIIARSKRLLGYQVKFSTGVDENSQKSILKAQEIQMEIMPYLDMLSAQHQAIWDKLEISYTDYIRTTENRHHLLVQKILQQTYNNQDIYQGEYQGLYCVGCESFKKESDLTADGLCPDHLKPPQQLKEKNYFFKLKAFQQFLENLYLQDSDWVLPNFRFNEIKSFVNQGLEDFSISRETNKFGIALSFDATQVTYVWYDALLNYLTVCEPNQLDYWPVDLHIVGKEIIKFHAIYWPAMLQSVGLALPRKILVTGHLSVNGQKISKSLGNVIDPVELAAKYTRDALVYYLFAEVNIGNDFDFNLEKLIGIYSSVLLGGWGNLVSRITKLAQKNNISNARFNSAKFKLFASYKNNFLLEMFINGIQEDLCLNYNNTSTYLTNWYQLVQSANKYIDENKPWEKLKNLDSDGIADLEFLLYLIKNIGLLSAPFLTVGFARLKNILINPQFQQIDTHKNISLIQISKLFSEIFQAKELEFKLNPGILYEKIN